MRKRYVFLLFAVLVVVGGWSGFWFYAAGEVERRLDLALGDLARMGTQVVCADRTIGGYPFRMEVRCNKVDVLLADGGQVSGGAFRAVALIYNPRHIIMEADAPFSARLAPFPFMLTGRWNVGHASLIFKKNAVSAAAVSFEGFDAAMKGSFGVQQAAGARAEVHVRKTPDEPDAADVAMTLDRASFEGPFGNADPFDAGVLLRMPDGRDWLSGRERVMALVGMPIEVREAYLARDRAKITATGVLTLGAEGYFEGDLQVTAVEPEEIADLVRPFYPPDSAIPAAFQGALTGFGQKTELAGQAAVSAKLTFRGGGIRIGFIPIAQMSPLF
ncbi:hypothetical protein C8N35_1011419 [Breoghania corrubedonensis]|uniref:DUF2125 domain-containing protein n=1 Tax=Breoghania corrubedonensis TaxID=665038 RepID=A0A2T5VHX7_9HYPH|nr:DUF2125 domain-containing protein [Breoghania corrubedonensis]PTW63367.1 hypothetical protein C8N35_1011419 [Breoghania corrubedonensis]